MASKRIACGTAITPAPIITRCSCSINSVICRREGGEPRPLHRVPGGRGRNPTADDPGDFATYRGTAAAAAVGTGMRRPIFMHQRQPTGRVRPNATQNGQTDPRTPCRSLLCRKSPYLGSGLLACPENRSNLPHFRVHPGNPGIKSINAFHISHDLYL